MQIFMAFFVVLFTSMPTLSKENTVYTNELIEIIKLDPTLKLDVRYATKNKF